MGNKFKKILTLLLSGLIILSFAACSSGNTGGTTGTPEPAKDQNKYNGKYNLVSINGDESIPDNFKSYYMELKEGNVVVMKADPKRKTGATIDTSGSYDLRENNTAKFIYDDLKDYPQEAEVNGDTIKYTDEIDGYEYIFKKE